MISTMTDEFLQHSLNCANQTHFQKRNKFVMYESMRAHIFLITPRNVTFNEMFL